MYSYNFFNNFVVVIIIEIIVDNEKIRIIRWWTRIEEENIFSELDRKNNV